MADLPKWSKDHAVAGLKSLGQTLGDIALNASAYAVLIIAKGGTQAEVKAIMDTMATPKPGDDTGSVKLSGRDTYASIGHKFAKGAMSNDELMELESADDVGKALAIVKDIMVAHRQLHECKSWAEYLIVANFRAPSDDSRKLLTLKRDKDQQAKAKREAEAVAKEEAKKNPKPALSPFERAVKSVEDLKDGDDMVKFAMWFKVYSERLAAEVNPEPMREAA